MQHIALFGGTFDPIHFGHLQMAESLGALLGLDEIHFVTAGNPAHKPFGVLNALDRHEMVTVALEGKAGLKASNLEIVHGLSHTIDTVRTVYRVLLDKGQAAELSFITSAEYLCPESKDVITSWHEADELLSLIKLIVVPRGAFTYRKALSWVRQLNIPRAQVVNLPGSSLSSGMVRAAVKENRSLGGLVPLAVGDLIFSRGYYR